MLTLLKQANMVNSVIYIKGTMGYFKPEKHSLARARNIHFTETPFGTFSILSRKTFVGDGL